MEITKQELEKTYYANNNKKAAKILGISTTTLIKCVKIAGIKLKGSGRKEKTFKLRII
jgi:DNA-binding protein Fis